VTSISYPDGSSMSFTYEPTSSTSSNTTGRLTSVSMRSGGKITYAYSGGTNGINCLDGTPATMKRTTSDGTWTYVHTPPTSSAPNISTTKVTDPLGNDTVYTFASGFEIYRQVYQGSSSSGTLLLTRGTCYNGATPNCSAQTSVRPPITELDVYTYLPGLANPSISKTTYASTGLVTESKGYDFGATNPTADTVITYGTYSNGSCSAIATYIANRPCTVVVKDGSGTVKAQTNNTYDSKGNLLSSSRLVTGSTYLTSSATYNANGTLATATDVNGATTTYSNFTCNGILPQTITLPQITGESSAMSTSQTWDCNGGVVTSSTDVNGNQVSTSFVGDGADPFWRPETATDALGNVTTFDYTLTSYESSLPFNGSASIVDLLTTSDGFGRKIDSQKKLSPSSSMYDTISYAYDADGRLSKTSVPCQTTVGALCSFSNATAQTYDGLGRRLVTTDGGGGTVSQSYASNDVLTVVGPPPSGEHTKSRQLEYDGLGRLTSVCEILSSGGTSCGQHTAASGYTTSYAYSVPATGETRTVVTQGVQSRTYIYDGLGRLISETNPESGTTQYFYDTDPGTVGASCSSIVSNWSPPYNGGLVKKYDANGNTTCNTYDQLHRLVSTTSSGPNAVSNRYFVYDAATVNSQTMANAKARMAEAYTATCPTCTKITDEGFSYSARGELTDVYESTPHSGGYYHANATYWANGTPETFASYLASGSSFVPTQTYTVDGEGRWRSVAASSGPNPISSTIYNAASQLTGITYGSSDSDSFVYDSNTGHIKTYTFTVNSSSESGSLTWNTNGTLGSLAITDPFNSADNQTCTYSYDDLARITSANCGSAWSQTFSYDQFGNITKTGSISWQPGYDQTTNRYTLSGTSYDADGNLTNDTFQSYTWDPAGRPVSIGSKTLTYDALGRMAEKLDGSAYSQFVYSSSGALFAIMSGQAAISVRVPLPGSWAVYASTSAFDHYEHLDWLGNSRLSSTQSRAMSSDIAYAPFGEPYSSTSTAGVSFTTMRSDVVAASGGTTNGLFDFLARELAPAQGRWSSPDPSGLAADSFADPQSFNRYAYVGNSTLNRIDPLGLQWQGFSAGSSFGFQPSNQSGCKLDGFAVPCEFVGPLLDASAAVPCPNNQCQGAVWTSDPSGSYWQPEQFVSTLGGSGYYAFYGPGALYFSERQAARAAIDFYEEATMEDRRERNFNVSRQGDLFSYNLVNIGFECGPLDNCYSTPGSQVPEGTTRVAMGHTHPYERGAYQFWGDRWIIRFDAITDYVGAPIPGVGTVGIFVISGWQAGVLQLPICQLSGAPMDGVSSCQ
jgi:RHS repeat-associated protein